MIMSRLQPFTLTPAEWLAIFPRAAAGASAGPTASFPNSLSSPSAADIEDGIASAVFDPASELRDKYPVDKKTLEDTLRGLDAKGLAW